MDFDIIFPCCTDFKQLIVYIIMNPPHQRRIHFGISSIKSFDSVRTTFTTLQQEIKDSLSVFCIDHLVLVPVSGLTVNVCSVVSKQHLFQQRKGFADIVFIPRRNVYSPAIVVELKHAQSADSAIAQIKAKQYTEKIAEYTGEIVLVGINYDDVKGHSCFIEHITK